MEKAKTMRFLQGLTFPTLLAVVFCALGGMSFGLDVAYWSGVLGMTQFAKDFGVYNETAGTYSIPSSWKSSGSGLPIAGNAIGAMFPGLIGRKLGRLPTLRVAYLVAIVGIIIQSASITSYWQLTVGRMITAVALGILANTIPTYLAEVAPLNIRGTLVNSYQFSIGVGATMGYTCNWGMHARTDQWAYRTAIILQAVLPCILIVASFFIPESPRWLVGKGRMDDARLSLARLRPTVDHAVIDEEIDLINAVEEENRNLSKVSWVACFTGTNLRRTLIIIGVQCLQQGQGSSFMSQYSVIFFKALGYKNVYEISCLMGFCMAIASAVGFYLPDRIGRRWIMIVCAVIMCACMCTVAGLSGRGTSSSTLLNGSMAALFIWQILLNLGWSSCVWIVTAEVPSLLVRERSITIATFCAFATTTIITFVSPYIQDAGYGNLGGHIGFIYGSISGASALWVFFFLPETGFRSLEELDELFHNKVSVWNFRKYQTSGYAAQLHNIEENVLEAKLDHESVSDKQTGLETHKDHVTSEVRPE